MEEKLDLIIKLLQEIKTQLKPQRVGSSSPRFDLVNRGPVFRYCRCSPWIGDRHHDDNGNCAKCGKPKDRRVMG